MTATEPQTTTWETDGDNLGFLREIPKNPDDNLVRMVYADWLDERCDTCATSRATFIRSQVWIAEREKAAGLPLSHYISYANHSDLLKSNEVYVRDVAENFFAAWSCNVYYSEELVFRRGFLTQIGWFRREPGWSLLFREAEIMERIRILGQILQQGHPLQADYITASRFEPNAGDQAWYWTERPKGHEQNRWGATWWLPPLVFAHLRQLPCLPESDDVHVYFANRELAVDALAVAIVNTARSQI